MGVFAIAMATVILPSLSQQHADEAGDAFSDTLDWALRWVVVVATPSAVGLALLADRNPHDAVSIRRVHAP